MTQITEDELVYASALYKIISNCEACYDCICFKALHKETIRLCPKQVLALRGLEWKVWLKANNQLTARQLQGSRSISSATLAVDTGSLNDCDVCTYVAQA